MILTVPEIKDHFYLLPTLDMWIDVFSVVATGTEAGKYAYCLLEWKSELTKGVTRIDVPTSTFWILGRTQTNGSKDYAYINKIQDAFKVILLSYYGKEYKVSFKKDPSIDDVTPPLTQVDKMDAKAYFSYAIADKKYPSHVTDMAMVERMKCLGLTAENFNYDALPENVKNALAKTPKLGHKKMREYLSKVGSDVNGWQMITPLLLKFIFDLYYFRSTLSDSLNYN